MVTKALINTTLTLPLVAALLVVLLPQLRLLLPPKLLHETARIVLRLHHQSVSVNGRTVST